jgi:23S rRNA (adenine2030-N6)-methyltransferase
MLRLELAVDAIRIEGPLVATGLIIVNPPFTLVEEARRLLPALVKILRRGSGASFLVEELSGEGLA